VSALNAFVCRDAVHVFTDAGVFDQDGRFLGARAKIDLLPTMAGVIAATGPGDLSRCVAWVLAGENPATFSDLISDFYGTIEKAVAHLRAANEVGLETFEIVIAVFDEQEERPRLAKAISVNGKVTVAESNAFRSPLLAAGDVPVFDPDHPRESGLALLERQRRTLCGLTAIPGSAAHVVGGAAHHTVIRKDGVSMSVIRRWPDEMGEPISIT
jgi:hypothetical protein